MDVEIKVFYANFSSEIGDDGARVVDVRTLATYGFQEDVDHEVTYQANIELLKVPEGELSLPLITSLLQQLQFSGIFLAFFDPGDRPGFPLLFILL